MGNTLIYLVIIARFLIRQTRPGPLRRYFPADENVLVVPTTEYSKHIDELVAILVNYADFRRILAN